MAETLGMPTGFLHSLLEEKLDLNKLCTRWVPKALLPDQRNQREDCSVKFLNKFDADPDGFMVRAVTRDENFIYPYNAETMLIMQWLLTGANGPIKVRS